MGIKLEQLIAIGAIVSSSLFGCAKYHPKTEIARQDTTQSKQDIFIKSGCEDGKCGVIPKGGKLIPEGYIIIFDSFGKTYAVPVDSSKNKDTVYIIP